MGYQIPERLLHCPELLLFSKHHYKLQDQKKNFDLFSLVFYHNHTWMIPKFIASLGNLVISGCGIIIITMISRYFQVWKNIDEKLVKNFCFSLIFCNNFFWNYFLLTFLEDYFFSISVTLDSVFILSVKNCFTVFQRVLLFVMSLVLILLKKFFFSLLIKLTQRLRYLLYAFLSMSLFVFRNFFLIRDLFMVSLFVLLFMKGAWFARTYRFFMGTCLWVLYQEMF